MNHEEFARLDASYLLGSLDPGERREYEEHLTECEACRAGLAAIRPVVPLLAHARAADFDEAPAQHLDVPMPQTLLPAMAARVGRSRSRRLRFAAAVGGLAAAIAIGLTLVLPHGTTTPVPMVALAPTPVSATVALSSTAWGTEVTLRCWYRDGTQPPAGYRYALTVHDRAGGVHQLGDWQLDPGKPIVFSAGTAVAPDQIAEVAVTDSDGSEVLRLTR